jgi:type VI secretion system protein ImpG
MYLSLTEPSGVDAQAGIAELSVRTLCTNRHLPELLPVGSTGSDFRLLDHAALDVACRAGPTRPREAVVTQLRGRGEVLSTGTVAWRLISILSTNHLGIVERGGGREAQALREILMLFCDPSDGSAERRVRGVRSVESKPVVRRLRQRHGIGAARGIEITVTLEDRAFEGSGAFLLGAVLDRFFAEYASMNHFTQTVVRTTDRGEIMRWPPRSGSRRPL